MQYQLDIFINSLNQFWIQLVNFVPKLLAVIVIIFFGWILAKIARAAVKRTLELMQFDKFAQKSGLEAFMNHGNFDLSLSGIISHLVYWLVIIMFITNEYE